MPPNLPKNLVHNGACFQASLPPHPQLKICSAVPEYTVKLKNKWKKTTSVW